MREATAVSPPDLAGKKPLSPEELRLLDAYWRDANSNPSLRPLLDLLRERYPGLSAGPGEF